MITVRMLRLGNFGNLPNVEVGARMRGAGGAVRGRSPVRGRPPALDRARPALDRALPVIGRAADHGVLWISIAAVLAATRNKWARRAALRGLASAAIAAPASKVLGRSLARGRRAGG